MLSFEKRPQPSKFWIIFTPILAVILTLIAGAILFSTLGKPPLESLKIIFWDPLFHPNYAAYSRPQLLIKAGPLILIAIGLSFGFKAGVWNIGAEGQYIIGAVIGGGVALAFYPYESIIVFPLAVLFGAIGGFLWAMIPVVLRIYFKSNEILVSLMLVYVAESILISVSQGLLRNPEGMGFPGSRNLNQYASSANNELITGTGLHWGVIFALISVIFAYFIFQKHTLGYQVKLTGEAPKAAKFAGVNPNLIVFFCLGISGTLAGLAGIFEVTGQAGQITSSFNSGYGFTAIIVAFLGRLHPVGILLAALLMALTYIGGELAQFQLQLPAASIQLFQGMLLFFLLAADILVNYRVSRKRS